MSRNIHTISNLTVGEHSAGIEKITGPGSVKVRTPVCSCGWEGKSRGRSEGIAGIEAADAERDAHLAEASL